MLERSYSPEMTTVLVVDDDHIIVDMLRRTFAYEGYQVVAARDGREALSAVRERRPDVIVLDWLLPGIDGLEVAKSIRQVDPTPILMLTARDAVEDRVQGLDSGVDDYLVKPFAPAELLARIRALLRRAEPSGAEKPLVYGDLVLDLVTRETRRGNRAFELTPKEFDLLQLFLRHPRKVLTRKRILQDVWDFDFAGEGKVLEVYIGYLRAKTEAGGEARLIHTVRGIGYVLR